MSFNRAPFGFYKTQERGLVWLVLLLVSFQLAQFILIENNKKSRFSSVALPVLVLLDEKEEVDSIQSYSKKRFEKKKRSFSQVFDPNSYTSSDWESHGFSFKQAQVIVKYKNSLGGFSSLEQLADCYVISTDQFKKMKAFVLIENRKPEKITPKKNRFLYSKGLQKTLSKKRKHSPFYPNQLEQKGWENLGFSIKQAEVILRYKKSLGGTFLNSEQIKNCYVVSSEKHKELASSFLFTEKKSMLLDRTEVFDSLNINRATAEMFRALGFKEGVAKRIIKYRESIGAYSEVSDLKKVYYINIETLDRVKSKLYVPNK